MARRKSWSLSSPRRNITERHVPREFKMISSLGLIAKNHSSLNTSPSIIVQSASSACSLRRVILLAQVRCEPARSPSCGRRLKRRLQVAAVSCRYEQDDAIG